MQCRPRGEISPGVSRGALFASMVLLKSNLHTYLCVDCCMTNRLTPSLRSTLASGHLQGAAISSFDYGSCIDSEDCSVFLEYNRHSGDAKSRDLKRALGKALLLTGPVAVVLLAAQKHF